jgi:uncharacterized membrane protein YqjE
MFIKRNMGSKYERWISIAILLMIVLLTAYVWIQLGKGAAIAAGILLFLLLDGFNCIWTLLSNSMNQRIGERLDSEDEKAINDSAKKQSNHPIRQQK